MSDLLNSDDLDDLERKYPHQKDIHALIRELKAARHEARAVPEGMVMVSKRGLESTKLGTLDLIKDRNESVLKCRRLTKENAKLKAMLDAAKGDG